MSHKAAGGIGSKNVVSKPYRTGGPNRAIRPGGVGQIGISQGSHITEGGETNYRGAKFFGGPAIPSKLGNEVAATTVCKPGGSRAVMKSGQQAHHGDVAGSRRPPGRGILNNE